MLQVNLWRSSLAAGVETYAGALVREARLREGNPDWATNQIRHTAELVRTAHVVSSQQKAVLRVVRNLAIFNGVIIVGLISMRPSGAALEQTIPLLAHAVLAAFLYFAGTFTLPCAWARSLAKMGVLSTRLPRVDEAATMIYSAPIRRVR